MDLHPNDDQMALLDMVRGFTEDRFPIETVRSFGDQGGFDRSRWVELAALGTFGIDIPETDGGAGLGFIDVVLVHESLGAALVPGPLVAATLAASVVDGVLDGSVVPCVVDLDQSDDVLVEHIGSADVLITVADDGVRIRPTADVTWTPVVSTDPTASVGLVTSLVPGAEIGGPDLARRWRQRGSLLASAQLAGNSAGSTALAVSYAIEREQFGRPIGSFQGLKHLLADAWIRTEVARSSVWSAGVTVDEPESGSPVRAIAGARLTAARAATENAKTCVQVHGGMGFTWEVDAHLFLKRAWILETQFGSIDDAADAVASSLIGD